LAPTIQIFLPFELQKGEMITWHGLADNLIFPNGTVQYYKRMTAMDPSVQDCYRFLKRQVLATGLGPFFGMLLDHLLSGRRMVSHQIH
jgi:hypothetical protein